MSTEDHGEPHTCTLPIEVTWADISRARGWAPLVFAIAFLRGCGKHGPPNESPLELAEKLRTASKVRWLSGHHFVDVDLNDDCERTRSFIDSPRGLRQVPQRFELRATVTYVENTPASKWLFEEITGESIDDDTFAELVRQRRNLSRG